jgi:hypothetical protein
MEAKEEANYKSVQPQKYATTYNDVSNDKEILLQKKISVRRSSLSNTNKKYPFSKLIIQN